MLSASGRFLDGSEDHCPQAACAPVKQITSIATKTNLFFIDSPWSDPPLRMARSRPEIVVAARLLVNRWFYVTREWAPSLSHERRRFGFGRSRTRRQEFTASRLFE